MTMQRLRHNAGIIVLLALVGLVIAGAFLLGKRGGRLDAMRADAAVRISSACSLCGTLVVNPRH